MPIRNLRYNNVYFICFYVNISLVNEEWDDDGKLIIGLGPSHTKHIGQCSFIIYLWVGNAPLIYLVLSFQLLSIGWTSLIIIIIIIAVTMQQWRSSRRNVKFNDVRHRSGTVCVPGLHSHEIVGDCCVVNADGGLCVRSNGLDLPTLYRQLLVPCEQHQVLCHVHCTHVTRSTKLYRQRNGHFTE